MDSSPPTNKRKLGSDEDQDGSGSGLTTTTNTNVDTKPTTVDLLSDGMKLISSAHEQIQDSILDLGRKIQKWETYKREMSEAAAQAKNKIKLDIGGTIFATSKTTLLYFEDSFFGAMLNSGNFLPGEDGTYFIDRDPRLFHHIIGFMRSGDFSFYSALSTRDKMHLKQEFDFYQLSFPSIVQWNKETCNDEIVYSKDGTTAVKIVESNDFNCNSVSSTATDSFKIRVVGLEGKKEAHKIMVGFLDLSKHRTERCFDMGYCYYLNNGNRYGMGLNCGQSFGSPVKGSSTVECIRDRARRTISFSVDGDEKKVAFSNVPDIDLYALCDFNDAATVELIEQ